MAQKWILITGGSRGIGRALVTGLARVWLGVHFISDVTAGLLIGALLLAARPCWRMDGHAAGWLLLITAALALGGLTQSAHLTGIGLTALGLWMGGLLTLSRGGYPPIVTCAVTLAGGALIGAGLWAVPLLTSSSPRREKSSGSCWSISMYSAILPWGGRI